MNSLRQLTLCRRTCSGNEHGLVPRANLIKIELHAKAPTAPLEKSGDAISTSGISTLNPAFEEHWIPLNVFRAVEPTNKIGGHRGTEPNLDFIGGFGFEPGDFLVESGEKNVDSPERTLTSIGGASGKAVPRRLQLIASPWWFPVSVPVIPSFNLAAEPHLAYTATKLGLQSTSTNAEVLGRLQQYVEDNGVDLPLFTLSRGLSKDEASSQVPFYEGEVVRVMEWKLEDDLKILFVDFEGNQGRIDGAHLFTRISNAFGLSLDRDRLPAAMILGVVETVAPPVAPKDTRGEKHPMPDSDEGQKNKRLKTGVPSSAPSGSPTAKQTKTSSSDNAQIGQKVKSDSFSAPKSLLVAKKTSKCSDNCCEGKKSEICSPCPPTAFTTIKIMEKLGSEDDPKESNPKRGYRLHAGICEGRRVGNMRNILEGQVAWLLT